MSLSGVQAGKGSHTPSRAEEMGSSSRKLEEQQLSM